MTPKSKVLIHFIKKYKTDVKEHFKPNILILNNLIHYHILNLNSLALNRIYPSTVT